MAQQRLISKVWKLTRRPTGPPEACNFTCVEEEIHECSDGDIIVAAEYLSVDPYMRVMMDRITDNSTMVGQQLARVVESKNTVYPLGTYVLGFFGWRSHTHFSAAELEADGVNEMIRPMRDLGNLPNSLNLGILGPTGISAYFGFNELCKPMNGDTVLVNAAAGAVGSAVVQIAKIKGCKVIGFAGTPEKVKWVRELGADYAFNYKTDNISESIKKAAPNGINCYFDNVGGSFTSQVLPHMADFGRIAVCGSISIYNDDNKAMSSSYSEHLILWKQLEVRGFLCTRWYGQWDEGLSQMESWVQQGKIKYKETITHGFENMPQTFICVMTGKNIGKAIVKV